jgi:hypothetical protein
MTVFRLDLLNKELCQYNAEEEGAAAKKTAPVLSVPFVTLQYRFARTFTDGTGNF